MHKNSRLVVIGASAGGVAALQRLASKLPSDFPAPILIVLHIGAHKSVLPELLNSRGPLIAEFATDGVVPQAGFIYVAPPDQHLLLVDNKLKLFRGAKENHARPAVDPLFRSAALSAGARVIGVVLTGRLDDGTAGLRAIQACGGTTVVQEPDDAEEASMPRSAMCGVSVDHVVTLDKMANLLNTISQPGSGGSDAVVPKSLQIEHAVSLGNSSIEQLGQIALPSGFSCPECGGSLFKFSGESSIRYRCHTGHAFGLQSLLAAQEAATDEALWVALRAVHEKEAIVRSLAKQMAASMPESEKQMVDDAGRLQDFGERLRTLLLEMPSVAL